jgi:hypothetical protein
MKIIAPLVTSLILALPATAQSSPRIAELLDTANDFVTVGNYRQAQEYFKKARRETQDACEAMHIAASELAAQELERLIRAQELERLIRAQELGRLMPAQELERLIRVQEFGARRDELSGGILCYRKWDKG